MGFALLCRLKSDATYKHAYVSLVRRVALLFLPYAAVLPIVSPDLVLTLLGPAWAPAAPIIAWFAPAVLGQAFATLLAQLLTSQGRGDELRRWAMASLVVRAAGAIIGSQFGIVGLAAGFSLATLLLALPMLWLAGRSGPVKLRDQLAALWPGFLLAGAASVAAFGAALAADALDLGAGLPRLAFIGGTAALVWTALCLGVRTARDSVLGRGMARE
jgi:PST family polysaccharide transporter